MVGHTLVHFLPVKSLGTLDRKKGGPLMWGRSVSGENIYAPGGSRPPAVHPVVSHFPNSLWATVIRSTLAKCVISGFHRGTNNVFALLGCYTALIGSYRHFGTIGLSRNVGSLLSINAA
jgi:hypothetical protein